MPADDELLNFVLLNVFDVGLAGVQHGDFCGVGVKASDFVACFSKAKRERKTNVTTSDNSDFQLRAFEKLWFPVGRHLTLIAPRSNEK